MDLTNFGSSPLEIALATPDRHDDYILNRDIFEQAPLELSILRSYPNKEILAAVAAGDYPEALKAVFPQILSGGDNGGWHLWRVGITPRRLSLGFGFLPNYDPALHGLICFRESAEVVVEDMLLLGLKVHRPDPDLTAKIEVSSSGPNGTHNLQVNLSSHGAANGSISISLHPESVRQS